MCTYHVEAPKKNYLAATIAVFLFVIIVTFLYTWVSMKICLINNLYPPHARGGAEQVVVNLAREYKEKGDEVVVITWGPWKGWGSWKPEKTDENGVIVYRYWVPNIFSYVHLWQHVWLSKVFWHIVDTWSSWSARIVREILRREKPGVVHTHNLMGIGFAIPRVIQWEGVKHVHTLHDVQLVEPSGVLMWNHTQDSWMQKMYSGIMKRQFGEPDKVIAPSKFLKEFYSKRGFFENSEWEVVRSEELHVKNMPDVQRPTSDAHFLFVGSLVHHKGIHVLMKTWEGLESVDNAVLHIVGSGPLYKHVKRWGSARKSVKVYGRLEGHELHEVYESCDVLVFPSICLENRPNTIVEAIEHGLRVIASDTGGVGDLLKDKKNTWLIEPGNVERLREKILEIRN